MKTTGMVRRLDDLGRFVLPKELRKTLDIGIKDPVEIYVEGDMIHLRKYHSACIFCNGNEGIIQYHGKNICKNCLEEIKKEF